MQLPSRMMITVPDAALFYGIEISRRWRGFEADILYKEAVSVLLKLGQDETVTSPRRCLKLKHYFILSILLVSRSFISLEPIKIPYSFSRGPISQHINLQCFLGLGTDVSSPVVPPMRLLTC
jgi:hypothetical protein